MSGFDYLRFADKGYTLPDGLVVGNTKFQTHSLHNDYSTVVVDFDGSLVLDDLWRLFWHIQIRFYAFVDCVWHEYEAHFHDGMLAKIEVV